MTMAEYAGDLVFTPLHHHKTNPYYMNAEKTEFMRFR